MRLHLTVQRHGLPAARILWTTAGLGPVQSSAGTISQLLEQVNDIIPLESEQWGLEDYTVEVGGFECLHFHEANQVLKEDDEVCIRPLSTSDLRFRKVSGRHQISTDGKHLIDGVAFGRPFLRRADRPAIRIPPRKRRRLTYDEDEHEDPDYKAQHQVVVHADFDNDKGSEEDSDYDGNAGLLSEDESSLNSELDDIRKDVDPVDEGHADVDHHDGKLGVTADGIPNLLDRVPRRRRLKPTGLGLRASSFSMDESENLFSQQSNNRLLEMLEGDDRAKEQQLPNPKKRRRLNPSPRKEHRKERPETTGAAVYNGRERTITDSRKSVSFDEAKLPTPATVRLGSSEDTENDDDYDGAGSESGSDETDESDKENATPGSQKPVLIKDPVTKVDSSSSAESDSDDETDSDGDETSSSGASESSSGSSSSEEQQPNGYRKGSSSSETSSFSGSSSSLEDEPSGRKQSSSNKAVQSQISKEPASTAKDEAEGKARQSKVPVPPGAGKRETQKRNKRRANQKNKLRLQRAGVSVSAALTADIPCLDPGQSGQPREHASQIALPGNSDNDEFERKRQALLQAISSGGVDQEDTLVSDEFPLASQLAKSFPSSKALEDSKQGRAAIEKSGSSASERTLIDALITTQTAGAVTSIVAPSQLDEEGSALADPQVPATASISQDARDIQRPRAKLDKDSSRRLVFGALGLRAPKTPEDERKLRAKLMKDAELPKRPTLQNAEENKVDAKSPSHAYDGKWEDKIKLSAVECCYDGIELSTPPFPFIQRWDPQQKKGYFAGGINYSRKSKKRKRNNKYYEASFEPLADEDASKQQQRPWPNVNAHDEEDCEAPPTVSYARGAHNLSDDDLQAANDQLSRETEQTYADKLENGGAFGDLPQLPEDVSAYPDLEREACSAGAIIAFKHLDMSAETNWQPIKSKYRTALVEGLSDDGTLSLKLAARDRPGGKKQYDPETGERVYSKFEMPGFNDDDSEDNDGLLELALAELIEPKLVRASEKEPESVSGSKETPNATTNGTEVPVDSYMAVEDDWDLNHPHSDVSQKPAPKQSVPDAEATEQVRQEIRDLITDAGWRSSIQSNSGLGHENLDIPQLDGDNAPEEVHSDVPTSPHFNGFSSSPPVEEYKRAEEQVIYPTIRGLPSPAGHNDLSDDVDQPTADPSSEADREAMQALREDFQKDLGQPIIPSSPGYQTHSPRQQESFIFPSSAPQATSTPPPHQGIDSPKSTTVPDSQPPNKLAPSQAPTTVDDSLINNQDSDSDFPSLQTVFTSFASQREAIKTEHHSSDNEGEGTSILQSLPSYKSELNGKNNPHSPSAKIDGKQSNKPPPASAPPSVPVRDTKNSKASKSTKPSNPRARLNRYEAAPRSSQDWIGTQVVDLTLSSDPVVAAMEEEDNDEYVDGSTTGGDSLPKGPGWVKKNGKGRTKAR